MPLAPAVVATLIVGALPAVQLAAPEVGPTTPALEAFAPLVGRTWRAAFPGGALHDTQAFEWMLGGAFLRNPHRVTDAAGNTVYAGETVYGFDHQQGGLRFWYFNTTGGHVAGTLVPTESGWRAEGENRGPEGQTGRVRSEIRLSEDGWSMTSFFFEDGAWKERFTMEFEAVP